MKSLVLLFICTAMVYGQDERGRAFDDADSNKDGFWSLSEYSAFYGVSDSNGTAKNDSVSKSSFLENYQKVTGLSAKGVLYRFDLMDENFDKKITKSELGSSFVALDTNKDGKITFNEYLAESDEMYYQLSEAISDEPRQREKFRQADKDNNGILYPEEFWSYIVRADKNGDQKVSRTEFIAFWNTDLPSSAPDRIRRFAGFLFDLFDFISNGFIDGNVRELSITFPGDESNGKTVIDVEGYLNNMLLLYAVLVKLDLRARKVEVSSTTEVTEVDSTTKLIEVDSTTKLLKVDSTKTNGCMDYNQISLPSLIVFCITYSL